MNFWEFKDDQMRGYFLPGEKQPATYSERSLADSIFSLIHGLLKLLGAIALFFGAVIWYAIRSTRSKG